MRLLIGGSPCTHWSIAQTKNRETEPSGLGWELFRNYLIALEKYKPDYFLYENNKSMSAAIRAQITKEFGFEPVLINSALVSAQNRQRLYWVGQRESDGTYSRVEVELPEDKGILLRDILETGAAFREKGYCLAANRGRVSLPHDIEKGKRDFAAESVAGRIVGRRIGADGHRDDYNENVERYQRFEVNSDPGKTNCLSTVEKDNVIAEPVNVTTTEETQMRETIPAPCGLRYERDEEAKRLRKDYESGLVHHGFNEHRTLQPRPDGKSNTLSTVLKDTQIIVPVRVGDLPNDVGEIKGGGVGAKTGLYATPIKEEVNHDEH